jgi:hypothetical protein
VVNRGSLVCCYSTGRYSVRKSSELPLYFGGGGVMIVRSLSCRSRICVSSQHMYDFQISMDNG